MDPHFPYVLPLPPNLEFMKKAYLDIKPIDKLL